MDFVIGSLAALIALAGPCSAALAPASTPTRAVPARALGAIAETLRISEEASELRASPALVGRLRDTPHGYFRFVDRRFSETVCRMFGDVRPGLPDVNLHGDAHIEQYAVTSLGRGLTDFDESARGPYVIDLVRFGVSLELAARQRGWTGEGRRAFEAFLRGYREALTRPNVDRPPRRVVSRARATFAFDHDLALRHADSLIDSDAVPAAELQADFHDYIAQKGQEEGMPASFFRIKKAGRLKIGVGSVLDEKYLLRVEGWTKDDTDDQILEAKLVRPLSDVECVHTDVGAERVPLGMALIAYAPFSFSGLLTRGGRSFWVRGWTDDYVELSIDLSFPLPEDLRQVAYDVGIQLGRAHPKRAAGTRETLELRGLLRQSTRENEGRIRRAIGELAEATVAAWTAFRGSTCPPSAVGWGTP